MTNVIRTFDLLTTTVSAGRRRKRQADGDDAALAASGLTIDTVDPPVCSNQSFHICKNLFLCQFTYRSK